MAGRGYGLCNSGARGDSLGAAEAAFYLPRPELFRCLNLPLFLITQSFHGPFKTGSRGFNYLIFNTEGQPEIAGAAETLTGNGENLFFLQYF